MILLPRGMGFVRPHGIIVPILTPFRDDGSVNHEALRSLVERLVRSGVHGVMPLGTSGEFALLSHAEREEVIRTVVEAAGGRVPVIAGVSDPGTKNTVENAVRAERLGVDAVIATAPYYYHVSPEGVFEHFRTISRSVSIPVMVYNIPSYTHTTIPVATLKRIAELDNVVGMKFTTTDFQDFLEALYETRSDKFSVMIGSDSMIFQAVQAGADGAVTGLANVAPRECVEIYTRVVSGDVKGALEVQRRVYPLARAMGIGDFPAALKEAARILGYDYGVVRPPLRPLSEEQSRAVKEAVFASGINSG